MDRDPLSTKTLMRLFYFARDGVIVGLMNVYGGKRSRRMQRNDLKKLTNT